MQSRNIFVTAAEPVEASADRIEARLNLRRMIKSARIGYTSLLTGVIASYVSNQPSPILAVLPTQDDCRDYSVGDVEGTFDASPALRGLLDAEADEAGRSTLLARRFPGGSLKFVAAKSPRNLRRHNARVLLLDEIDGFEIGAEGDPLKLAEMRTLAFNSRKIIAGSTPVHDHGPVSRLYAESDQRVFEVPCPECGDFSEVLWANIEWPAGRPEEAAWTCPVCGSVVQERHKAQMVSGGRWRATQPQVKGHAGFRINALVSQGRRLAADVADRAVAYLEQGNGAGPIMSDGETVFHASRGNIEELDVTDIDTVINSALAARSAMPKRKGKGNVMIGAFPSIWLVPSEFEPTAIRAVASISATEAGSINPLAGKLKVVAEPRLTEPHASYLVADPSAIDGFIRGSLAGQPGPYTESRWGFEVDAIQFKIRLDLALAFLEWRGWTRLDHVEG